MTRFGRRLLTTLALLAGGIASAQDGVGRSAPLPGSSDPDAAVLRKLTAQLGGGNAGSLDLADLVRRFAPNGKLDRAGLERMLGQMRPDEQMKMLEDIRKLNGGQLPGGVQLPPDLKLPNLPPIGPLPQPPVPQPAPEANPFPNFPPPGIIRPGDPRFPEFRPQPLPQPFNPQGFPNGMPNTQSAKEAIEFWEKNVGSLNEMPAVRDALIALANSGLDGGAGGKSFWSDLGKDLNADLGGAGASNSGFLKWLKDNTSNWSLGSGSGNTGWTPPGGSWGGSSGGGGFGTPSAGSISTAGIVILSLIAAVVIGLFVWKVLPVFQEGRAPRPLPGHGPWPVDPRSIRTREQLVKAFEYLSVMECGDRARTWNHVTIAEALRALVPDSAAYAGELARLYAVARYTPESEPITDAIIAEARSHLCQLARVSPA